MNEPHSEFVLIRHGQTAWNAANRIQGHIDIPLNTIGLAQAAALGGRFSTETFDAIYSSDLDRAYRTAAPIAERSGRTIRTDARLRERHLGVLEGLTRDEAIARWPAAWAVFKARDPEAALEGGESLKSFFHRIKEVLTELRERHCGQRVLLVTHGGVLDAAYRHATAMPLHLPRDFSIENASINVLMPDREQWRVQRWGDVSHLTPA